jgi:hypothetical protein
VWPRNMHRRIMAINSLTRGEKLTDAPAAPAPVTSLSHLQL